MRQIGDGLRDLLKLHAAKFIQQKEMCDRVYQSGNYYKALNIISEYVETELSEKTHTKSKNEKERGDAR